MGVPTLPGVPAEGWPRGGGWTCKCGLRAMLPHRRSQRMSEDSRSSGDISAWGRTDVPSTEESGETEWERTRAVEEKERKIEPGWEVPGWVVHAFQAWSTRGSGRLYHAHGEAGKAWVQPAWELVMDTVKNFAEQEQCWRKTEQISGGRNWHWDRISNQDTEQAKCGRGGRNTVWGLRTKKFNSVKMLRDAATTYKFLWNGHQLRPL